MRKIVIVVVIILGLALTNMFATEMDSYEDDLLYDDTYFDWIHTDSEKKIETTFGKKTAAIYKSNDGEKTAIFISTMIMDRFEQWEMISPVSPFGINELEDMPYLAINPYFDLVDDYSYSYKSNEPSVIFIESLDDALYFVICAKTTDRFSNDDFAEISDLESFKKENPDLSLNLFQEGYILFEAPCLDEIDDYSLYAFNHQGQLIHEGSLDSLGEYGIF